MRFTRRIVRSRTFQVVVGFAAAWWLRIVWMTNRAKVVPPDIYEQLGPHLPAIVTMWHGQHFLMPFVRLKARANHKTKVLISRHHDGELNAIVAEHLGIGTIRGSGDTGGRFDLKGGVGAFKGMIDALKDGWNVALTADVPKIGRRAGEGVTKLAAKSGRPIYAVAIASSRRSEMDTWDRSVVNLPFGRIMVVVEGPIYVPDSDDARVIEQHRLEIERRLNAATARAYAIVDGKEELR
jgi:lysophospholipid acyltransferase (LPLAT)-like uncharacterized protein